MSNKDIFDYVIRILQTVVTLWTGIIGYKVYRNLDSKKNFRKKQVDYVLQLLADLQNTRYTFMHLKNKENGFATTTHFGYRLGKYNQYLEEGEMNELLKINVPLRIQILGGYNLFLKYGNNYFIPEPIANKLDDLIPSINQDSLRLDYDSGEFAFVLLQDTSKVMVGLHSIETPQVWCESHNAEYQSPKAFIEGLNKLVNEILKWLKDQKIKPNYELKTP